MSEKEKRVSCYRGIFPDVPIRLNPEGIYSDSQVSVLITNAQKHCGQECPPNCGYRQVVESFETNKKK